jgi:hypothetical protein
MPGPIACLAFVANHKADDVTALRLDQATAIRIATTTVPAFVGVMPAP